MTIHLPRELGDGPRHLPLDLPHGRAGGMADLGIAQAVDEDGPEWLAGRPDRRSRERRNE